MASSRLTFRLNVPWDTAIMAIERAARDGRRRFTIQRRDNGYLGLQARQGVSVAIQYRIESPRTTMVSMAARQGWRAMPIGKASRLDRVLGEFREDVERELVSTSTRPASLQPDSDGRTRAYRELATTNRSRPQTT